MVCKGTKSLSLALAISLGIGSLPAHAVSLTTEEALTSAFSPDDERARLQMLLARADVQAALVSHGVDAQQAALRVAALSDEEVALLNQRIDSLPAGGNVVGAIVFVFLVLLVTDILGLTKVFPFTRSIR